ncbi:histone deacetylase [Isosphaeraceae bacterium EP7]
MVTLYSDRRMLDHVPKQGHPERPERLQMVLRQLERTGQAGRCGIGTVRPATDSELLRVHTQGYLDSVSKWEEQGGGQIEADTWMSAGTTLAARLAAGSAVEAVHGIVNGGDPRGLCVVRPPGHHARPDRPMGFCLYANVAVAAAEALEGLGLSRILIVDWDVHHGNGTQEIFERDPRVGFLSIHRWPFYPGTGAADETGTGPGLGMTRNVPLPYGISRAEYLAAFRASLSEMADRTRPELVILSAGFDAHAEDPVGDLGLETEDFDAMTRDVLQVAETWSQGRLLSVLEGGYNVPILAGCVSAHLDALGVPIKADR